MANPYIPKLGPSAATALPGLPRRKSKADPIDLAFNWQPTMEYSGETHAIGVMANNSSLVMSPDGLTLIALESSGANDNIVEFSLTAPFEISTMSFVRELAVGTENPNPVAIAISVDGSKLYMLATGSPAATIYQYTLPNAFSLLSCF